MKSAQLPPNHSRRNLLTLAAATVGACSLPQEPVPQTNEDSDNSLGASSSKPCWSALQPLPFAVQEIYPIAHDSLIHLAGGLIGSEGRVTGVSDRHIAYDPTNGATLTLGSLPSPRHHPQLVSLGGKLYCLGGFETHANMVNWIMTAEALVYEETGQWTTLTPAPERNAETVAAAIDNRIHIVGGRRNTGADNMSYGDHTDSNSHLVFDPDANAWQIAAPAPTPRNSAAGALIGKSWHVVGGRQLSGGPIDTHEVYDPADDTWRTAAPLPEGVGAGGNAAGVINGKLYAFGGEFFGPSGGGVHAEVCAYDPQTDTWEIIGEMPTPRHGLGGVTMADAIYAVGGATRPGGNGTSAAVERLSFSCA